MLGLALEKIFGGFWGLFNAASKWPIFRIIFTVYLRGCGSYVGLTAKFHGPPVFPHGILGIFISGDAVVGQEAVIFQHVTIGTNSIPGSKGQGAPKIGRSCYIGAGAKIIGGVTIGDNVRIGANCIVTQDIPDNSVVVAQRALIISRDENLDNRFFQRRGNNWHYTVNGLLTKLDDEELTNQLNSTILKNK